MHVRWLVGLSSLILVGCAGPTSHHQIVDTTRPTATGAATEGHAIQDVVSNGYVRLDPLPPGTEVSFDGPPIQVVRPITLESMRFADLPRGLEELPTLAYSAAVTGGGLQFWFGDIKRYDPTLDGQAISGDQREPGSEPRYEMLRFRTKTPGHYHFKNVHVTYLDQGRLYEQDLAAEIDVTVAVGAKVPQQDPFRGASVGGAPTSPAG